MKLVHDPHEIHSVPRVTSAANRLWLPGLLLLLVLNVIVFWPVLAFDFVRWDDDINITQNTLLTDPWSTSLVARLFDADHALRFKPLHWLLGRAIYSMAGLDPAVWHAFNLILHLGAVGLFFVVLRQVLGLVVGCSTHPIARIEMAAFFGAAFWSMHPLRAEPVAWATASTYPLSAVCMLGAFACYLRSHTAAAGRAWLVSAWLLAVLGYASYPVTVTFGLWLIAVDQWLLVPRFAGLAGSAVRSPIAWRKHAWFLGPAVLAVAMTLWSRLATPGIFSAAPTVDSVGLGVHAVMALASLSYLAGRIAWPFNLTPNVPPLTTDGANLAMLTLAAIAAAILLFAWRLRCRRPLLALTCLGFAAVSLPCLGLTERPTWPVDRYSYVAHLPLIGSAVVGLASIRVSALLGAALAFVTVGSAVAAQAQAMIWRDTNSLFTYMAQHPDFTSSPRQQGHIFLLWAYHEAASGRPTQAEQYLQQARQVYVEATHRAVAGKNYAEALSLLSHVEHHFGLTPILRREKGAWLLRENRAMEARRELQMAAEQLPGDQRLHSLLTEAESLTAR